MRAEEEGSATAFVARKMLSIAVLLRLRHTARSTRSRAPSRARRRGGPVSVKKTMSHSTIMVLHQGWLDKQKDKLHHKDRQLNCIYLSF